jgi:hypothetical protein
MKKLLFIWISLLCALAPACKEADKQHNNQTSDSIPKNVAPVNSTAEERICFEMHFKKDVSELNLTIKGEDVTGELNVLPYEKDGAVGTLKGKKSGNTINAEWSYMIEGSQQAEEVEFKIEGDKAFQRLGELEDKNGKLVLKATNKIEYSDPMTKVACK